MHMTRGHLNAFMGRAIELAMADNEALTLLGTNTITDLRFFPEGEFIRADFSDGSFVDLDLNWMVPRGYFGPKIVGAIPGAG